VKKRIALALTVALLLLGTGIGALPSEAASPDEGRQTAVYKGYTVSWSSSDPSDVRIERTPGQPEHFPRAASSASVDRAKSRVAALSSTSTAEADSCTAVPDTFGRADFTKACDIHDYCYSPASDIDRADCDLQLLFNLRLACYQAYATQPGLLLTCYTVAAIYYIGVRLFGAYAYAGTGEPF
jgi:Prokaryotic phospholipase A2